MGKTIMREAFQIFVKPAGAACNLGCSYCYYLDKKNLYAPGPLRMSDEILEKYISQHIEATPGETVMFSWHGGEPLLAGIDFYRKAVALQKHHIPGGKSCLNGIQTNATLVDEEWARFLASENFIAGVSIDGPEHIHNIHRRTADGRPSFTKVMNGYRLLRKHDINPEILCVVNSFNCRHPHKVYDFFRKLGPQYITFLPLVERTSTGVSSRSVPPLEFGKFLAAVYDSWAANDIGKIRIQIFEEAASTAFGHEHTLCIFKKECGGVPVIEHNGDFYSCDHYVNSSHLLGNIRETPVIDLINSTEQNLFGMAKWETLPQYCVECNVRDMCNGECPKNRFMTSPDGEPGVNYLCEGYKYFFNHCKPMVDEIARLWKST